MIKLIKLLAYLPLGVLYRLADLIYVFAYYLTPYRKPEVFKHLQAAFPDKSPTELRRLAQDFYRNAADIIVETIKALRISETELKRRVTLTNPELLQPYQAQNQSLLLMAAHQCNWEWLLLACGLHLSFPLDAVYKPLRNPAFDDLFLQIRSRFGARPVPVNCVIRDIMQRRQEMRGFAMLADQSPIIEEEKYWATFLHQDTVFPVGADKIARLTRYPVLFVGIQRLRRGYYSVTFEPLAVPPYAKQGNPVIAPYVAAVERQILAQPANWLWSYRKWKYKKSLYD